MSDAESPVIDLTGKVPQASTNGKEISAMIVDDFGEAKVFFDPKTGKQGFRNRPVWVACYNGHLPSILIPISDGHHCEVCGAVYTAAVFETALREAMKPNRSVSLEAV